MSECTILYAEDDENDVFLVTRAFKKAQLGGLRIVQNGREAVEYLQRAATSANLRESPRPCLVLLDLNMPFLSGIEVLAWIRRQPSYAGLPVLMFTSSNQEKDIVASYDYGVSAYLIKPSSAEQLVEFARTIGRVCAAGSIDPTVFQTLQAYQPRPRQTQDTFKGHKSM